MSVKLSTLIHYQGLVTLSFAFENKKLNGNLWYIDDNTPMEFPKATRPKPVWQERLQF